MLGGVLCGCRHARLAECYPENPRDRRREHQRMASRPLAITIAVILLVLLSLTDLPLPWGYLFPSAEAPPAFILYLSTAAGIVGLIAAVGLWRLKRWSL